MKLKLAGLSAVAALVATDALVKQLKASSVALIVDSTTDYTKSAAQAMTASLGNAGIRITTAESITPGATSYADTVTKVLATNPSAVYVITYFPEAGLIAQAMLASNTAAKCLADYGAYDNDYITAAGIPAAQKCPVARLPQH